MLRLTFAVAKGFTNSILTITCFVTINNALVNNHQTFGSTNNASTHFLMTLLAVLPLCKLHSRCNEIHLLGPQFLATMDIYLNGI